MRPLRVICDRNARTRFLPPNEPGFLPIATTARMPRSSAYEERHRGALRARNDAAVRPPARCMPAGDWPAARSPITAHSVSDTDTGEPRSLNPPDRDWREARYPTPPTAWAAGAVTV